MLHLNHKSARSQLAWLDLLGLYRARTVEDASIRYGMIIGSAFHLGGPSGSQVLRMYQQKREELTACQKIGF